LTDRESIGERAQFPKEKFSEEVSEEKRSMDGEGREERRLLMRWSRRRKTRPSGRMN
jgi:hypothetical protein